MNALETDMPALLSQPAYTEQGIYVYQRGDYNKWFEDAYSTTDEPWNYSHRGAERYRHRHAVGQILKFKPTPQAVLELGSSRGLMTELLIPHCQSIYASDISLTALKACKKRCDAVAATHHCRMEYFVTTTPGLPFAADSFDVVTVCDGFGGWWFSEEQKVLALQDVHRVLKEGGIVILTDFIMPQHNPQQFDAYKTLLRNSPLHLLDTHYLYDRLWYLLESVVKKTGLQSTLGKKLLPSLSIAGLLHRIGSIAGRKLSCHIVLIAKK